MTTTTMLPRKHRTKPTAYPNLPFHMIRSAQFISSTVVAAITSYFLSELQRAQYHLPWTFILLLAVSALTMVSLGVTTTLHVLWGVDLGPGVNAAMNGGLGVGWSASLGLLSWWSRGTLAQVCDEGGWESATGVGICRAYKALFCFALVGVVATLAALVLDGHVRRRRRRATGWGKFTALRNLEDRDTHAGSRLVDGQEDANPNLSVALKNKRESQKQRRGGDGYGVPEEQFMYDEDTTYYGAGGGEIQRHSPEEERL